MASSASLGATGSTNSSEAKHFYETFNRAVDKLRTLISSASSEQELQDVTVRLSQLRQHLTDSTSSLPTHDQESHERNIKSLSNSLTRKREELVPKKRFTFKRNPAPDQARPPSPSSNPPRPAQIRSTLLDTSNMSSSATTFQEIKNKSSETLVLRPSNEAGKSGDLHLKNMSSCKIDLRSLDGRAAWSALQVRNCSSTVILAGRIEGSVMLHNISNCTIVAGCKQFRLHNASNCTVILSTSSLAALENGSSIKFGPADDSMLGNLGSRRTSGPVQVRVQDFKHVNPTQPSPNWSLLSPAQAKAEYERVKW